jgi:hypothetical protein
MTYVSLPFIQTPYQKKQISARKLWLVFFVEELFPPTEPTPSSVDMDFDEIETAGNKIHGV